MKTLLYLLRHGATPLNLEKPYRLQGNEVDTPLAPTGILQARQAADWLRGVPISTVYSSPLLRARQTAEIIATPHALDVISITELREGSVGRWENRTWDEIKANEPEAYQQFMDDPGNIGYAGGESFNQVLKRVRPVFHELLHRHQGESIAVVGHQIVNRVIVADLMGLEMVHARRIKFANAGITMIGVEEDKPILVSLNISRP